MKTRYDAQYMKRWETSTVETVQDVQDHCLDQHRQKKSGAGAQETTSTAAASGLRKRDGIADEPLGEMD